MQHKNRWFITVLLILATLLVAACSGSSAAATKIEPAHLELIDEAAKINRVTLTEKAVERLDIQTDAVREEQLDGAARMVVPYSSILYDLHGETWLYTNPEPNTYIRAPITVEYIDGDMVVLTEGPALGTTVVTVGAAELFGTDTGVGK
jgi:hypothetical protein